MSVQHWLSYRGALRALAADGEILVFVTAHPEGQPTGIYRLDPLRAHLEHQPLPGGIALAGNARRWWVADPSGQLHAGPFGQLVPVGPRFDPAPSAMVALPSGPLALLVGSELWVLDLSGSELRRVQLDTRGTALAVDPTGTFLVAGSVDGTITVLSHEGNARPTDFEITASAQLHSSRVTALRFDPDEPRFRSLGLDGRFLVTHARGALEPLDRGGRSGHSAPALGIAGDGPLVYTAGEDGLKAWARDNARAPSTLTNGVGKAFALVQVTVEGKPHLAAACRDDTLRLFPLEAGTGKILERSHRFYGAIGRARRELMRSDVARRRAALDALAGYDDAESIALIHERVGAETDHALAVHAVTLLGRSTNPRSLRPLEEALLRSPVEAVRRAALDGLLSRRGRGDLPTLALALSTGHPDLGVEAVAALADLVRTSDAPEARATLIGALDHGAAPVRDAALAALEGLSPDPADPGALLLGLRSQVAQLRWKAALRLFQRGLLQHPQVTGALRQLFEDSDGEVRQLAYHLALLSEPRLAARLRCEDPDLHRQLHALEHHGEEMTAMPPPPVPPDAPPDSVAVLLQASAARKPDTALRGASHLALLGDGRAFGVLLQLSREIQPDIVVRVCRALERLADPRALGRLKAMLRSETATVRDAAFSALRRLLADSPLLAAQAGLLAPSVDVRHRGLSVLIEQLKMAQSTGSLPAGALELLRAALNDPDPKLRADALKATLSLGMSPAGARPAEGEAAEGVGSEKAALRFALSSTWPDLRREVLTELMAALQQSSGSSEREGWAWPMLLELFDDPHPELRADAYAFARKKARTEAQEHEVVAAALGSRFPDLRLEAVSLLSTRVDAASHSLLARVLDDDDERVRTLAFEAVQRAGADEAILAALSSRHPDVHIRAAQTLAERGRPEALPALLAQVEQPRPELRELEARWTGFVKQALLGLAALQDRSATAPVLRLLQDKDPALRAAAAQTLAWIADAQTLRSQLTHADEPVRRSLATGLCWLGDPLGSTLVFTPKTPAVDRVAAALALGDEERLLALLDESSAETSALTLKVLILHDWAGTSFPELLLAALSAASPLVRFSVAQILEVWSDRPALEEAVVRYLSRPPHWSDPRPGQPRGPHLPLAGWLVRRMALAVRLARGRDRAAAVQIIAQTTTTARSSAEAAREAELVAHRWHLAVLRSQGRLENLLDPGPPAPVPLEQLVYGTYAGLAGRSSAGAESVRAAATLRLALGFPGEGAGRVEALLPGLSDPSSAVRMAALEALAGAGLSEEALAEHATATGCRDVGQAALERLASRQGADALLQPLRTLENGLELAALELYQERTSALTAATAALGASSSAARSRAVALLQEVAGDPEQAPAQVERAKTALKLALSGPWTDVRQGAALALAKLKDPSAHDALVPLLYTSVQSAAIQGLAQTGDDRASDALLDRILDDPEGTAISWQILQTIGELRKPAIADRLFALAEARPDLAHAALTAVRVISGYDQYLQFQPEETDPDESWLAQQHPRHDGLLARLLRWYTDAGALHELQNLRVAATWAKGDEVNAPLLRMLGHGHTEIRRLGLEALGWRVRFRGVDPGVLVPLLSHRDPVTAFLAAEALAWVRRGEGLLLLLGSVDALKELAYRRRAVLALGWLADPRALELLLRIVDDPRHELLEVATEALGHLKSAPQAGEILSRLLALSKSTQAHGQVARRALVGLRWFGTLTAWSRIREAALAPSPALRAQAVELLGHDTGPSREESRQALVERILEDEDPAVGRAAAAALRKLDGPDSLEPDYVALWARHGAPEEPSGRATLQRLRQRGDRARLVEIISDPRCQPAYAEALLLALSQADPLPIEAAHRALLDPRADRPMPAHRARRDQGPSRGPVVGARLLGHARTLPPEIRDSLPRAAEQALAAWSEAQQRREPLARATERVRWTLWAAARHGLGSQALAEALQIEGPGAAALHLAASDALVVDRDARRLEPLVQKGSALVRASAAGRLAELDPALAASVAPSVLSDRTTADRLVGALASAQRWPGTEQKLEQALANAADQLHLHGVVLPHLVARQATGPLQRSLHSPLEAVRLGALEALGLVGNDEAEQALRAFATDEGRAEDERKVAWRALRRSRRRREQARMGAR